MKTLKAQYGIKKRAFSTSITSVKSNLQAMLELACDHYMLPDKNGDVCADSTYLSDALSTCISKKGTPIAQVQDYIERVCTVEWTETKKKNGVTKSFKKRMIDGEKVKPSVDYVYLTDTSWFDHAPGLNTDKPTTDVDKFRKQLKAMVTKGKKFASEDRVEGDTEAFDTLLEKIAVIA